ncbi:MAG: CZB domain-containing protein [Gammaproteobacteria bacterium]|nr:CZB domain-containing protein [Gammaproteobacteria bacterium]
MNFDKEIKQHLLWRSMVESLFNKSSKEFALPSVISNDHHCQLGRWIYSHDSDAYSDNPYYNQLREVHKEFHATAGTILTLFQQGEVEKAQFHEPEFYMLSDDVVRCLEELKVQ